MGDMSRFAQAVTFLRVSDLARTHAFYHGQLGLEWVLDQGVCRIYRVAGDAYVGFCTTLNASAAPHETGVILTLVTDDVSGRYAALRDGGVVFEQPPRHNPKFNIEHCFLRDPDGYLLEIQRFCDPQWPAPRGGA